VDKGGCQRWQVAYRVAKRHIAGTKKIDDRHHMNICNKIHNTANNSAEIITEDFVGHQLRQHRRGRRWRRTSRLGLDYEPQTVSWLNSFIAWLDSARLDQFFNVLSNSFCSFC
jgi:hypothetical protein